MNLVTSVPSGYPLATHNCTVHWEPITHTCTACNLFKYIIGVVEMCPLGVVKAAD